MHVGANNILVAGTFGFVAAIIAGPTNDLPKRGCVRAKRGLSGVVFVPNDEAELVA